MKRLNTSRWCACTLLSLALVNLPAWADKSDDTLRIGWGADGVMVNADNYFGATRTGTWFSKLVWDTLVERNPETNEYEGGLATRWQWVDDQTLEMQLRQGVMFHNGEAFTADDVVFTLNTMSAADSGVADRGIIDWIDTVEKVDDHTIRIHTKAPFPQALAFLSSVLPIYPQDYYQKAGSAGMAEAPVGTGPYRVVKMQPGQQYQLEANPDYTWGSPKGTPAIGHVEIREIPDVQTQVAELMSGGIDLTPDLTTDMVQRLQGRGNLNTQLAETLRIHVIGFDLTDHTANQPIQDLRVRQAINYAIDKRSLVDNLMGGAARVIYTPCHPLQFGCSEEAAVKYEYDPDKAKALLTQAGYPDGIDLTMYAESPAKSGEAIVDNLAKAGIRVAFKRLPYDAYRDAQISGKAPSFLFNWGSYSLADAAASVSFFFKGGEDDFSNDEAVQRALDTADTSVDEDTRKAAYDKAIERITSEAYWAPLYSGVRGYGWRPELAFTPYSDEMLRVYDYHWN